MNDDCERTPIEHELAAIGERLSKIDQTDVQLTQFVQQLYETVQQTTEARAHASLEIATSLQRIREASRRVETDRAADLHGLLADIDHAMSRATELQSMLDALICHVGALDAQIARASTDVQIDAPSGPAAPLDPLADCVESDCTLVVTGVPSAATALSIQRFCTGLPGVVATTTRSYQQGELRIDLQSKGLRSVGEFDDWPDGILVFESESQGRMQFRMVPPDAAPVKA